jgi:exodeoxyribonuclease VIII
MKIIETLPSADYHAHPAVSKSVLDKIAKSPMHARAYLDGTREEPTAAMNFGTALHACALEPERFADEYAVFEGDRRTKDGKARYEELQARGATIISAADYDAITAMVGQIRQHPVAAGLLQDGIAEASVFWNHPPTGIECKCRPDWWKREAGMVVDLKTTEDASPEGFARSVAAYRYHVQAAHYSAGTKASRFVFIAIEKKPPYAVAVYELDADALTLGHKLRDRDLEQYASCLEFNTWPGYPAEIQTIILPKWAQLNQEQI